VTLGMVRARSSPRRSPNGRRYKAVRACVCSDFSVIQNKGRGWFISRAVGSADIPFAIRRAESGSEQWGSEAGSRPRQVAQHQSGVAGKAALTQGRSDLVLGPLTAIPLNRGWTGGDILHQAMPPRTASARLRRHQRRRLQDRAPARREGYSAAALGNRHVQATKTSAQVGSEEMPRPFEQGRRRASRFQLESPMVAICRGKRVVDSRNLRDAPSRPLSRGCRRQISRYRGRDF